MSWRYYYIDLTTVDSDILADLNINDPSITLNSLISSGTLTENAIKTLRRDKITGNLNKPIERFERLNPSDPNFPGLPPSINNIVTNITPINYTDVDNLILVENFTEVNNYSNNEKFKFIMNGNIYL